MSIEETILESVRALPADKQQELLNFADFLSTKPHQVSLANPEGLWEHLGIIDFHRRTR